MRPQRLLALEWLSALAPSSAGQKSVIADAVKGAVSGAVGPVIEAIKAIWLRQKDDNALMRKTIETQLEAAAWPAFASILSAT
jgi:hypothetical protein